MKFGVTLFPTDESISVTDLAPRVEDCGFESFFVPEHSHLPVYSESRHPFSAEIPRLYAHFLDPFVALSAAAAVTSQLKLGTGICLVAQRDPIQLAKTVASLDHISGGRFLFGVAAGFHKEEMENHGTRFRDRWAVMRENIEAMRVIWREEEAEFHGRFVNFAPVLSWPKPAQASGPPVLIGGEGPRAMSQAAEFGDEWMPRLRSLGPDVEGQVQRFNDLAAAAGRGPLPVTTFGAPQTAEGLAQLERSGVGRCIFTLPSAGEEEVLPALEKITSLVRSFA